ncbi:Glycerol-3-phosphate dehydrogenase 1-like protein [Exaiptasia diaphana]|nr:Glycerol-3-phosphate dehydrogenase 1-like protein [Exaiptasia diaphana]
MRARFRAWRCFGNVILTIQKRSAHNTARKVAIVGSGNWGTTIARVIGSNVARKPDMFHREVQMYVFDSVLDDGRRLTDVINTDHVNVKNLPGHVIPPNVVANPDLQDSVKDADILVFNLPPMFLEETCAQIKGKIKENVLAISMIKGLDHSKKGLHLISSQIKEILEIPDISVMMGANIAEEVANEMFSESTIGSKSFESGRIFKELLSKPYFKINVVKDVEAVEFCGAFKNCIALGAGIIDGLGYQNNTKAAVIRIGLEEAYEFSRVFLPGSKMATFFESCGIADFIVTCYGGKHRLVGEAFVKTGKQLNDLEAVVPELRHRKLPGPDTLEAVYELIEAKNLENKFPLITSLYRVFFKEGSANDIITVLQSHEEFPEIMK